MRDFMTFRRMITPIVIQVLFWIGVVVIIGVGLVTMFGGLVQFSAWNANERVAVGTLITGLLMILLGPIVLRMYAEVLMVLFRMNETLTDVCNYLRNIDQKTHGDNTAR